MPSDNKPENPDSRKPPPQKVQTNSTQLAMAMEVPFTFVGAVALGGLIGYLLDKWLHTGPWLMIVFGCFGFAAGILEIVRRFRPKE
jgi:F0F1-type ATP synthase assembly protein I